MAIGRPISLTPNIATKNISSLATADQTEFTVTGGYRINEIAVYRNGVRLAEGRDFTASDGDTVNLVTAASDADVIEFAVFDSFNVSDAIVSAASSQNLNGDFNVTGIFYAGDFKTDGVTVGVSTVSSVLHVGTALTAYAAGDIETIGIITAASFKGDGSGLTGIGETVNVRTNTITVSGVSTFTGAVNVDATTDSTSSSTGALIVDGGLGVAKNVYIGAGLSVAGTLTYEDVTSVDSVGLITAKSGVNITGGQLTVGSGITMGIAGVATFSGTSDVHLLDNVRLNVGDGSDLAVYHAAAANYITGTPELKIQSGTSVALKSTGGDNMLVATPDGAVTAYYDNSAKLATTNDGVNITGIATATSFSGSADIPTGGAFTVGSGITMAATSGVVTFANGSTTTNSLHFGSPAELKIYHDGSNHYIRGEGDGLLSVRHMGTGDVELFSNADARIRVNGGETAIECNLNSSVDLYHNNIVKLQTSSTGVSVAGTVTDSLGNLRDIPLRSVTGSAATLVVSDAGKVVSTNTTGWTVPASTFSEGDTVTLLNNSGGGLTITCSAVTTYLTSDGTTVTSKTLGARGLATLYFVSASVAYLQGTSLS